MLSNSAPPTPGALTVPQAAQLYRDTGLSVIPIRSDGSKQPQGVWKAFQTRLPNDAELQRFRNGCGVAVIGGKASGNLEVLDFDKAGLYEKFAALCADHGLQDLIEGLPLGETPSGGHHLCYRCERPVEGNQQLATLQVPEGTPKAFQRDGKWWKCLIETRGEGGYAITSPTPAACHPAKRPYRLVRGSLAAIPVITALQRNTLLNLARVFNEYVEPRDVVGTSPLKQGNAHRGTLRPGDDFNQRGDYQSLLEKHGWTLAGTHGNKGLWKRPGKTEPGISATSNYAESGLFYAFSTNAHPFEARKPYTPFSVYALLEHGGDFQAAAKALAAQGYGQQSGKTLNRSAPLTASVRGPSKELPPMASSTWPDPPDEAAYYGLAGELVRIIEPETEADPIALLIQFILAFGNVIGRHAYFVADGARHYLNLFAVLVGLSSKGRKGTSWAHVGRSMNEVDSDWATSRILGGLSSGEGVIWAARDPIFKTEAVKEKGKPTGEYNEVMVDAGIQDKRLLVQEAEFASVLRVMGREGNNLSAILRQAWDTGCLRVLTKNNPAVATDAHISIIGHITQEEVCRYLDVTESANGFGNRFLWACVKRSQCLPEGGRPVDLTLFTARLRQAVRFAQNAQELRRDGEARELWCVIYPELSEGQPGLSGALTGRAEAQTMRLAALYALLDTSPLITRRHLEAALALWDYCERSVRFIFGDSMGDPVADEILRALRQAHPNGLTLTDISHGLFKRNQKAERISAALDKLQETGRACCEMRETDGRAAQVWFARHSRSPFIQRAQVPKQQLASSDDKDDKNDESPMAPESKLPGAADIEPSVVNVVNIVPDLDGSDTENPDVFDGEEWEEGEL